MYERGDKMDWKDYAARILFGICALICVSAIIYGSVFCPWVWWARVLLFLGALIVLAIGGFVWFLAGIRYVG